MNSEGEEFRIPADRPDGAMEPEGRSSDVFTLPNVLSMARILLTPVFVWSAVQRKPWLAFGIFLLAGVTDALDGFAARKFRLKSHLGLWLDPLGDKILMAAAFIVLAFPRWGAPNVLPLWLPVVCVGRDVLIAAGVLVYNGIRGRTTFKPSLMGKASTICQIVTLLLVLLLSGLGRAPRALVWLYALTAVLTGLAGIQYIVQGMLRFFRTGKTS
jgi:cardiolipin synthase